MSGASTTDAATGVRPKVLNLSTDWLEVFPQLTTFFANSAVGMLSTHSPVARNISKVWFWLLTTQPTSGGTNSIIVCHDMGMMFARPARGVVTSTAGPGSSNPYTCASGISFLPFISPFLPMHVFAVESRARLLFLARMADGNAGNGNDRRG